MVEAPVRKPEFETHPLPTNKSQTDRQTRL